MNVVDFSKLNKLTAKSFNDQKALIKKVMAGRSIKCPLCQQPLKLVIPSESSKPGIYCSQGCTNIELDFS